VLYLIGSGLIYSLPSDIPYRFYFRLVFRAGTIGSSVLFGLAFYIITRRLDSIKVKDYLIISAMGIIMIGIANEISALQQTYGAAAHSLVLLASYLFSIGLYCSALSVSQDTSLRKIVRKSTTDLLDRIGTAQMEKDIEKNVMKVVENNKKEMEAHTGISTSITDENIKEYLHQVIEERRKKPYDI
jgi:DNA-binding TFAR19-related protein (PDSD5 family)